LRVPDALLREHLLEFLKEDVGFGDVTTESLIPEGIAVTARIVAKEPMVAAGILEVTVLFETVGVEVVQSVGDGSEVSPGETVIEVRGDARAILTVERTALNLLMRMSGIATATRRLVNKIREAGFDTRIAATRKTAPGLRYFDKRAVILGGGDPHRSGLDEAVLIKDNHIAVLGSVAEAVRKARSAVSFTKKVEVEVRTPEEAVEAARSGADIIMLDNMSVAEAERAMELLKAEGLRGNVLVEVSGGITEENVLEYAELRPDVISVGSLTHSVKAVDLSLEIEVPP